MPVKHPPQAYWGSSDKALQDRGLNWSVWTVEAGRVELRSAHLMQHDAIKAVERLSTNEGGGL